MLQEEPSDARVCCKRRREQGRKYPRLAQIEPRSVKLAERQKRVDCIACVWPEPGEDPLDGVVECTP